MQIFGHHLGNMWEYFFKGGVWVAFLVYGHIFTYTYPNGSGVGAIDGSDPFKHAFDPHCILEVLRKIFMDEV